MLFFKIIYYSLIIIGFLTLLCYFYSKLNNKSKIENVTDKNLYFILLNHIEGLPNIDKGAKTILTVYPEKIVFDDTQIIPLDRIERTQVIKDVEITEKEKSVVMRAIAGGILLGPLGAIIGSISGVGTKRITQNMYFLSIDFINVNNEQSNVLLLADHKGYKSELDKISVYINEKIGIEENNTKLISVSNVPYEI